MNNVSVSPEPTPVKRAYDATRRQAAAALTRHAVLGAARELFLEQGYAGTTMISIAARSGVALDTVYTAVGRKPALIRLLVETAISGADEAVPPDERDYVRAIQAAADAPTKIALYAHAIRDIAARLAPLLAVLAQAAQAEPELATLWSDIAQRRAANMRRFAADLAAVAELRVDVEEAADVIWSTNAPEFYQLLVDQRGWTPERYEAFLVDVWQRVLLAP